MKFINLGVSLNIKLIKKYKAEIIYWSYSRTGTEVGAYFSRVEVLVDDAFNDTRTVIIKKAGAGFTKSRYQLVQSLGE